MHWAKALLDKRGIKTKGRSRSNHRRTVASDGYPCPSALHCSVYENLLLLERAGEISNIRKEVRIRVCGDLFWKIDFVVFDEKRQCDVGHEAKGQEFERYIAVIQAWAGTGPFDVVVWKGSWQRPFIEKTVRGIS